jgi:hypothetical protein
MDENYRPGEVKDQGLAARIALKNAQSNMQRLGTGERSALDNLDDKGVKPLTPEGMVGPHTPRGYKLKIK